MDYLEKCYQKDPNMVSRKIADEFILVPIRQNVGDLESIYTLNETAARIWELIDGKIKVRDIKERIVEEFEVKEEAAESDLIQLIDDFGKIQAIEEV
ncbi:MAG: PqqD family protein [Candidatus Zixiibacteriota bacterium]